MYWEQYGRRLGGTGAPARERAVTLPQRSPAPAEVVVPQVA